MNADDILLTPGRVATRPIDRRAWMAALTVLVVGLATMFALFQAESAAALKVWLASTAFGHCFLVAPIALWLAWERRAGLAGLTPRPVPALAVLAVPLIGVWFLAERLGIMEGRQFMVLFLVWLLVLSTLGFAVCRVMAAPILYMIFLVPFGAFLVPMLQDFTARFVNVGLSLFDVPHLVTATLIQIPEGDFLVAEACAGLRFLIAAIAFGALYACMIYRSAWRRIIFIGVCIVVPVLANGVRALGIVMLGHLRGSAEAGAVDHVLYGWIFFSLVILLLVLLGLPFRDDAASHVRPAPVQKPARSPLLPGLATAAAAVVMIAAAGPVGVSWLDYSARAETAGMAPEADRLAAALVVPAGCVAQAVGPGERSFDCDGVKLAARVQVFSRRSGPAVLHAWRDAADVVGAEDAQMSWFSQPGQKWRMVVTREPDHMAVSALWVDGVPAPEGLALRLKLARDTVGPPGGMVVLAEFSTPSASSDVRETAAELIAAQKGFPTTP